MYTIKMSVRPEILALLNSTKDNSNYTGGGTTGGGLVGGGLVGGFAKMSMKEGGSLPKALKKTLYKTNPVYKAQVDEAKAKWRARGGAIGTKVVAGSAEAKERAAAALATRTANIKEATRRTQLDIAKYPDISAKETNLLYKNHKKLISKEHRAAKYQEKKALMKRASGAGLVGGSMPIVVDEYADSDDEFTDSEEEAPPPPPAKVKRSRPKK